MVIIRLYVHKYIWWEHKKKRGVVRDIKRFYENLDGEDSHENYSSRDDLCEF